MDNSNNVMSKLQKLRLESKFPNGSTLVENQLLLDVKSLCAELLEEQKSLKKRLQKVEENQKIENAKIKEELENLKNGGNRVADNSLFEIFVFDDYKYHAVEVRNSYLIRYVRVKVANLLNNDLVESFNLYYGGQKLQDNRSIGSYNIDQSREIYLKKKKKLSTLLLNVTMIINLLPANLI
ncbi:Ubiquitin-like domain-containing protein [Caenorhabditis elegans]|uniref:Ubiquitin-like domain-containing protein n=1 Tax=Caenorhabditis elegans TaxID=6239 RepID=P91056_CAEEL|nr:Ubiquitin-like domain-containing protein [Caenorhabditis elegans]CCD64696.1 Ubiquitin-like domain-containing protein [Caenorhabditis elegans]|eukprot:NP_494543.1 Uncharacterized protein CELE_C16C8.5 [Caenorhabditis elegans]